MTRIVVADIGGTHARFAIATLEKDRAPVVGRMFKYRTREHAGLGSAWSAFAADLREPLPRDASLAIAAPIEGETLSFSNSDWVIPRLTLGADLGLDRLTLVNDFGAVAHAVSVLGAQALSPIAGPPRLPDDGIVTVLGPGTGLGAAILVRRQGSTKVIETEAGHMAYAPLDDEEAALVRAVAQSFGRASIERIVSGPGLINIYDHLGGEEKWDPNLAGQLWSAAIDGTDVMASRALDILVRAFGAAAGDIALAHGAMGVVVTGSLANRIRNRLGSDLFRQRFVAKGRFEGRMKRVAVMLATYDEPGLLGAAVAFGQEHLQA